MLGHALVPNLRDRGNIVCAPTRGECDVTSSAAIAASLDAFGPDAIVHMAAYTSVSLGLRSIALSRCIWAFSVSPYNIFSSPRSQCGLSSVSS